MAVPKPNLNHLADLSHIPLSRSQKPKLDQNLQLILTLTHKLQKLNLDKTKETNQLTGSVNRTRQDRVTSSLTQKQALLAAKQTHQGFFVVRRLIHHDQ